jgi:hypothetical protein
MTTVIIEDVNNNDRNTQKFLSSKVALGLCSLLVKISSIIVGYQEDGSKKLNACSLCIFCMAYF